MMLGTFAVPDLGRTCFLLY